MRELIMPAKGQVVLAECRPQALGPGQVRVRCRYGAAKHGTEMAHFKGITSERGPYDAKMGLFLPGPQTPRYPGYLGNMCVGQIVEVGAGVDAARVGETVFAHGHFREEHVWDAGRVRALPEGVPWQAAVCLDPADFALAAVRDGNVRIGDAVAVFGMGAIGLLALQLARLAGAHPVIAVEPLPRRRKVAEACGADLVLDPTAVDAGREIRAATGWRGADVCIDYSGHHLALQGALRGVVFGGTVVAGAWPGPYPAGLDFGAEAHFHRPRIVFTRACSDPNADHPAWSEPRLLEVAWRLLAEGRLRSEPIVDPIVDLEDLPAHYARIATAPGESIKLGVRFP